MLLLALAMILNPESCQPVMSTWIVAGDLAKVEPAFQSIDASTRIIAAPTPGQVRQLKPAEIARLAAAHGIAIRSPETLCFSFRTVALSPDSLRKSMEAALADRGAQVKIVDQCSMPAPEGKVVFPVSGLSGFGPRPVVWRGYIDYAEGKRFYTWARVQITVHEKRLVTKCSIKAGERLDASQLELAPYDGPLTREPGLSDVSIATTKMAVRDISQGTPLAESMLEPAPEVNRGELISVIASSGPATVESQGFAQQSGKIGDVISIRNPQSGKIYRGRVQRGGIAIVVSGGYFGIVPGDAKS